MSFWMLKEKPSRWWASGRPPHSAALRRQLRFWKRRPSSGRGVAVKGADFQCFQGCWCIYTKRYRSVEQLMRILPGIYAYNMCIYRLYTYIDMCVWTLWDGDGERERERSSHIWSYIWSCMYISIIVILELMIPGSLLCIFGLQTTNHTWNSTLWHSHSPEAVALVAQVGVDCWLQICWMSIRSKTDVLYDYTCIASSGTVWCNVSTYVHTYIHACMHAYRHTDRQPARQPDSQTARQPGSQTARHPHSQTASQPDRHTHTHLYTYLYIYI